LCKGLKYHGMESCSMGLVYPESTQRTSAGSDLCKWLRCQIHPDLTCYDAYAAPHHRERRGWQRLLRRGVHTLRHDQYQLLYVDTAAPLSQAAREGSKVLAAEEVVKPSGEVQIRLPAQ
jgi:hypothetical protein